MWWCSSVWRKCRLSLHLLQRDEIRVIAMELMQAPGAAPCRIADVVLGHPPAFAAAVTGPLPNFANGSSF
jgi:hypothetical protein